MYGVFIGQNASTVDAYRPASMTKFQVNPRVVIKIPPTNGPIILVPVMVSVLAA